MKRLRILSLLLMAMLWLTMSAQKVYVLPIESEIDQSALRHFRQGEREAINSDADLLVIRLNTYGGAVDAADSIRTALLRCPLPTVAFVDVNAASAGALIALACDSVYMSPVASMGAATVVNGAGEPMPGKYQSYMSTIMRATAEHHGRVKCGDSVCWRRNPEIAAAMVNPEESRSLTARQAVDCGYADGIASSLDDVLTELNMPEADVQYYVSTLSDDVLGFLANAAVRAVLVMLIIGGIYMEMHTPGLGFAGAVSATAAILYFLPVIISGTIPAWVMLCILAGVVLIVLELFVVPGFGVTGISGIIAIVAALVGVSTANDAVTGVDFASTMRSLLVIGIGCVLAVVLVAYLTSSHGPKCVRKHSELMTELTNDAGFVGVDMAPSLLVGSIGAALTDLRPSGKVVVDGNVYDAVSTGAFILAQSNVKVLKYENAQIYVEKIS